MEKTLVDDEDDEADGKEVHEIVVFSAQLKSQDCQDDVFLFIDRNMPRHVVFILEYEGAV